MEKELGPITETQYCYYAFISYSRKDQKWASWLQKRLETYRLPTAIRKSRRNLPKKIAPVFRDETDLNGSVLEDSLQRELERSQYLIVVCSPGSAASKWVDKEISYFASLGRQTRIIPFVVEGIPFSGGDTECFPEAIRKLERELLGVSVQELGKKNAFLRVVSTLLNLRYDELVMREKKRTMRSRLLAAAAALVLLAGTGWGLWYNLPHRNYYSAYTLRQEIPQGLYPLEKADREGRLGSYRITVQRGKVMELAFVNSMDIPADNSITVEAVAEYPVMEYTYDDNGRLASSLAKNEKGESLLRKTYSYHDSSRTIAVDYEDPDNETAVFALGSALGYAGSMDAMQSETKSQITREVNTYDEQGLLIRTEYQSGNLQQSACDSSGVYGKAYTYDENGLIRTVSNLDREGNVHDNAGGWSVLEYAYNDAGQVISCQVRNAAGEKVRDEDGGSLGCVTYDDRGSPVSYAVYDEKGEPCICADGYFRQEADYDDRGFLTALRHYDIQGQGITPAKDTFETRTGYTEDGRIESLFFYGVDGQLQFCPSAGCAGMKVAWNADGRIALSQFFGENGEQIPNADNGACQIRMSYDKQGRLVLQEYLDQEGNRISCQDGYAQLEKEWDSSGQLKAIRYLDADGKRVRSRSNIAQVCYEYDIFGNVTRYSYLDETGAPCYSDSGYAVEECEYENGNLTVCRYLDTEGTPTVGDQGYHEKRMAYDDRGNLLQTEYRDTLGNRIREKASRAAVIAYSYDSYGNCTQTQYYDEQGQPSSCAEGYSGICTTWENGRQTGIFYYDTQGEPIACVDGYHSKQTQYDALGRATLVSYWDTTGKLVKNSNQIAAVQFTYDTAGNQTGQYYYDEDGVLCQRSGGYAALIREYEDGRLSREGAFDATGKAVLCDSGFHVVSYEYDSAGQVEYQYLLDTAGELTVSKMGYAVLRYGYDNWGNCTLTEYYGTDGKLCIAADGYARILRVYDGTNLIRERYYDADSQPVCAEDGIYGVDLSYDTRGNVVLRTYLDGQEQPAPLADGGCAIAYTYDPYGNVVQQCWLDADGNLVDTKEGYAILRREYAGGDLIGMQYFDAGEQPVLCKDGYHTVQYTLDSFGRSVRAEYRDASGRPVREKSQGAACITSSYDNYGNQTTFSLFDENGDPILGTAGFHKIVSFYEISTLLGAKLYDTNGEMIREIRLD